MTPIASNPTAMGRDTGDGTIPLPAMGAPYHDILFAARLFIGLSLLYVALSGGHLYTMDDHTNFHVVDSLATLGTPAVSVAPETRHLNLVEGADGKFYSYYGVGGPIIYFPFYLAGKIAGHLAGRSFYLEQAAMSLTNSFFTALTAALIFLVLRRLGRSPASSFIPAILYAFATSAFVWAKQESNTVIVGALFIIAVYLLLGTRLRAFIAAGCVLGFAVNVRYDALIGALLIPAAIWIYRREPTFPTGRGTQEAGHREQGNPSSYFSLKNFAAVALAMLPFAVILLGYNAVRFGSFLNTGYPDLKGPDHFGMPIQEGLYGLLLSPNAGLLFYSPILLLLFPSWMKALKSAPRELAIEIGVPAVYVLFYAKNRAWHGGLGWGPRYLASVLPLAMLSLSHFSWGYMRGLNFRRAVLAILLVLSVSIQWIGSLSSIDSYHDSLVEAGIDPLRATHEPALAPLLGVFNVIENFTLEHLEYFPSDGPLKAGGYPATRNLRCTPDYWPFYAWKLNVSPALIATLWLLLMIAALVILAPLKKAFTTVKHGH